MGLLDIAAAPNGAKPTLTPTAQWGNPVNMVTDGRRYLDNLANSYLIKPTTAKGIGGFVFDYEGETRISAEDEITDHYTESNEFFQDHDAHKPLEIVMRGFVGELTQIAPLGVYGLFSGLQNKLTTLPYLFGSYTPGALAKVQGILNSSINVVNKIDDSIARAQNIVGLIKSKPPSSRVQDAFAKLMALRDTSQVFTLETPFGTPSRTDIQTGQACYRTFVIRNLAFIQEADTKSWADISVTLKEVRFASVVSGEQGYNQTTAQQNLSGRAVEQKQGPTNLGKTAGISKPLSVLLKYFS